MKKILSLLLLLCSIGFASPAMAQNKPKTASSLAFTHTTESSQGRTHKTRFRKSNRGNMFFDLHAHSIEQFRTAKSNKMYRFR